MVAEKRKSWIYEVPLPAVHHLRENLNAVDPEKPIPVDLLDKYDAPVIAGAIKLWILELDPPIALWEGWEDIRKLYPTGTFIQTSLCAKNVLMLPSSWLDCSCGRSCSESTHPRGISDTTETA